VYKHAVERLALFLVLGSAVCHAAWNAIIKREADSEASSILVLGLSAAMGFIWALWSGVAPLPSSGLAALYVIGGGLFEALYFTSLGKALQQAPLGAVYPAARGGAMLIVWPISILALGEPLHWLSIIGTTLLVCGLWRSGAATRTDAFERRGMFWAWVCALSIGGYHLCQKQALMEGLAPPALFTQTLLIALPLNLLKRGVHGLTAMREAWTRSSGVLLLASVLCTVSFGLLLTSLRQEGAGLVLTLRNTSILFAIFFGLLQGERLKQPQWEAGGLVLIGAVLLGWPSAT